MDLSLQIREKIQQLKHTKDKATRQKHSLELRRLQAQLTAHLSLLEEHAGELYEYYYPRLSTNEQNSLFEETRRLERNEISKDGWLASLPPVTITHRVALLDSR